MNLPNRLTLSRLAMAVLLILFLELDYPYFKSLALITFVVAGLTDYLDGYLARNVYGVTSFGKLMDPLTDKVIVCAAFVCLTQLQHVRAVVTVIIISREFLVTGLRLLAMEAGKVISAGRWGKHKTVWQIVAIIVILLGIAVRRDLLGGMDPDFLQDYDLAFKILADAVSIAVAMITAASGWMYLSEHRELYLRHI